MNEEGMRDAVEKFGNPDGTRDTWAIKNYLALPCSNAANTITEYTVKSESNGLSSTINPATENYFVNDNSGKLNLLGGGKQFTPGWGTIGNGTPYTP